LLGIVPEDPKTPFDIREVIGRVVDGSIFDEFKPLYGPNLVNGWAHLNGMPIGILANNGILFSPESQKGAQFIELCNQLGTPLLFVQNITGFMVGTAAERGGIIKDGAKLINTVANSRVPHVTLMVGVSFGAGNYAMAGKAYRPRLVLTWPSHRIAVMGGRQLAGVMSIVRRRSAEAKGVAFDELADAAVREEDEARIESESTALYATGRVWDDGIIDPRRTRAALTVAFAISRDTDTVPGRPPAGFGVFRF
jgi:acetyl-CoA carboxylase carboxyltransferase component